jgi:hypothetical protein
MMISLDGSILTIIRTATVADAHPTGPPLRIIGAKRVHYQGLS